MRALQVEGKVKDRVTSKDTAGPRIAIGLLLSLACHAALLGLQRATPPLPPLPTAAPPVPLTLRLRAPPPPPPPVDVAESLPAAPALRGARRQRAPDIIAMPERSAPAAEPAPAFVVAPPAPAFDAEAARRAARRMANEHDPAREGTALAQFPEKPLQTESKYARAIGNAARRDCKDGLPGGLLAPLYLLADKKDSGCKW